MYHCPYCGKWSVTKTGFNVDHILPKALWKDIKRTEAYMQLLAGKNIPTVNDSRNMVRAHTTCNLAKSDKLWIPDWSSDGLFKHFTSDELFAYFSYFWFWREAIKQVIIWRIDNEALDNEALNKFDNFITGYKIRLVNHEWYLDGAS